MSDVKLNNNRVTIPKLEFAGFETGGGWGLGEQFARLPPAEDQLKQNKLVYKVARSTTNTQTVTHSGANDGSDDTNNTDRTRERSCSSSTKNNNNEHEKKISNSKKNKASKADGDKVVNSNNNNNYNNKNIINQKNGNKFMQNDIAVMERTTTTTALQPSRSPERLICSSSTKQIISKFELEQQRQESKSIPSSSNNKIVSVEEYPSESMVHETQYNVQAEDDDNTFIDHGSGRIPWYANSLHGKSTPSSSIQGGRSIESTDINIDASKPQTVEHVALNQHHAMQSVQTSRNHATTHSSTNNTASVNNKWTLLPQEPQIVKHGQHELTHAPLTSSNLHETDNQNNNYTKTFVPLIDTTNRIAASSNSIKSFMSNGSSSSEVAHEQIINSTNDKAINGEYYRVKKANSYSPLSPDNHHHNRQHADNVDDDHHHEKEQHQLQKEDEMQEQLVHEKEEEKWENRKTHKIDKNVHQSNSNNNNNNDHVTVSQAHSSPNRTSRNEPQTWLPLHLLSRMTMTNYVRDIAVAPNGHTLFTAVGDDPLAVLELDGADLRVSSVMETVTFVYCMAVVRIPCTRQTTFKLLNEPNSYVGISDSNNNVSKDNTTSNLATAISAQTSSSFFYGNANANATGVNANKNASINLNLLQRTNSINNNSNNNSYNRQSTNNANNEAELVTLTRRGKAIRTRKQIARQVSYETNLAVNGQSEESYVLWCGMARGTICVVDLDHNTIDGFIANAHSDTVHKIWYLDNGKVWTSGRDKAIKVWDPQTRRRIKTRHIAAILNDMCYVHCTQQVWGIADDNIIRVYEAEGGNVCLTRSATETVPNAVKLKSEINLISCYGTKHEYVWAGMVRNTQLIDPLTYEVATSLNLTLSAITFYDCQAIFVGHGPMVESEVDRIGILDLSMPLQPALMYLGNEIKNVSPIGIRLFTTYPLAILAHEVDETQQSNKLLSIFTYAEMPPIRTSSHYAQESNVAPQRQVNMGRRAVTHVPNNNNVQNQVNNVANTAKINNDNTHQIDEEVEPLPESYTKTRIASKAAPAWNGITTATNTMTSQSNHYSHHQREYTYDAAFAHTQNISSQRILDTANGLQAVAPVNSISALTLLSPQESQPQQQQPAQFNHEEERKQHMLSESLHVHNPMASLSPDVLSSIDSIKENAEAMKYMLINLQRAETPLADFTKLHESLSSHLLNTPELLFALTNEERSSVEREYQTPEGKSMGIAIACLIKRKKNNAKSMTHGVQPFLTEKSRPYSLLQEGKVMTNIDDNNNNNDNIVDNEDDEDILEPSSRRYTLPLIDNKFTSMNAPRKSDKQQNSNNMNTNQTNKTCTEAVEVESNNAIKNNNNKNNIRLLSEERAKSAAREEIHELSQCWYKESEMHHKEVQMLHRYHRQSLERNTALISGIARIQEAIQMHLLSQIERIDRNNNSVHDKCMESVHDSVKSKANNLESNTSINNTSVNANNSLEVQNGEGNKEGKETIEGTNSNTSEVNNNRVISTRSPSFAHEHSIERERDIAASMTTSFSSLSMSSSVKEIHSAIDNVLRGLQMLMRDGNKLTLSSELPQESLALRQLSETCNDVLVLESDNNTNCTSSEFKYKNENSSPSNCKSADVIDDVFTTVAISASNDVSERRQQEEHNVQDTFSVTFCPVNPLTTPPLQFIYVLQSRLNNVYETIPTFSSTWNRIEDLHRVYYSTSNANKIIRRNGPCNDSINKKKLSVIQSLQMDFTKCKWLWDVMVAQMMVDVARQACLLNVINVLTEVSESNLFVATPLQSEVEQNAFYMEEVYNNGEHHSKTKMSNTKLLTNSLQIVDGLCVLQPYASLSDRSRTLQLVDANSASLVEVFLEFESLTTRIQHSLENIERDSKQCTETINDSNLVQEIILSESKIAEMYNNIDANTELLAMYNLPKENYDFMTYLRWTHIAVSTIHQCALLVEKFIVNDSCSEGSGSNQEKNSNNTISSDKKHDDANNDKDSEKATSMCKANKCTSSYENNLIIQQKLKQWTLYLRNIESEIHELLAVVSLIINMHNKSLSSTSSSLPSLSWPLTKNSNNTGALMPGANKECNKTLAQQTNVDAKIMECTPAVNEHTQQITVRDIQDSRYADIIFIYLLFIVSTHYSADELFFVQENGHTHQTEFVNGSREFEQLCDVAKELNVLHQSTTSTIHLIESLLQKIDETVFQQQQQKEDDELQEERYCQEEEIYEEEQLVLKNL